MLPDTIAAETRDIQQAALRFQFDVASGDRRAQETIARYFDQADQAIQARINDYLAKITAAQQAGTTISENWVYQVGRLDQLSAYAAAQYTRLGVNLNTAVASGQQAAISSGVDATMTLMNGIAGDLRLDAAHFDTRQLNYLVGALQDGSPLKDLTFSNLSVDGAARLAKALANGAVSGQPIRQIARQATLERNLTRARAMTIARTEILRAARTASLATMQANSHLLKGWRWSAVRGPRTCGICFANQGTLYPVGTPFESHPNCRCVPVPQTKGWSELETGGALPPGSVGATDISGMPTGADWIRNASDADLHRMYGPTRTSLLKSGYLSPGDLVGSVDRGRWGRQPALRSVADLKGIAMARGWTPPPTPVRTGTKAPAVAQPVKAPPKPVAGGSVMAPGHPVRKALDAAELHSRTAPLSRVDNEWAAHVARVKAALTKAEADLAAAAKGMTPAQAKAALAQVKADRLMMESMIKAANSAGVGGHLSRMFPLMNLVSTSLGRMYHLAGWNLPLLDRIRGLPTKLDTKGTPGTATKLGGGKALQQAISLYNSTVSLVKWAESRFDLRTQWSGVSALSAGRNAAGVFGWDGHIGINARYLGAKLPPTLLHEVFHSMSPGSGPAAYRVYKGWEEGVAEMATRTFMADAMKATGGTYDGPHWAYQRYNNALESLRAATGMSPDDFYGGLIQTDLSLRNQTVQGWIRANSGDPTIWSRDFYTLGVGPGDR